jgi:elongation factor Ts
MAVTAEQVKELREATGVGILECQKALKEVDGDYNKAVDLLREKGLAKAAKRANRDASEGTLELYTHGGGRLGVMVEVNCETDFVAKTDGFREFAHEIAMQIAATAPLYVKEDEIPADVLEHERQIAVGAAKAEGKPEAMLEKIAAGRVDKYKNEVCLLRQPYIRDESLTVEKLLNDKIAAMGENIVIRRFARWELGERTEKE